MGEQTEKKAIEEKFGKKLAKIMFQKAMQAKWIAADKKTITRTIEGEPEDATKELLQKIKDSGKADDFDAKIVNDLKKRKLVQVIPLKYYSVSKGINYNPERIDLESELTAEMLRDGSWKEKTYKRINTKAFGAVPDGGHLHPLLKVRTLFKEVLIEMGFEEMPTDRFVESSFWNFDALFQPQQHPARDAHDTFFLKDPSHCLKVPGDYLERVKGVHEKGGYDSIGYDYDWSIDEAKKNILRTHTTAISSNMLYKLA